MQKRTQKHTRICAAVTLVLLFGLILWQKDSFLEQKTYAYESLSLASAAAIIASLAVLIRPKVSRKWPYALWLLFVYLFIPLLLIAGVECLNKQMLWEIDMPVNILMNYLLCLTLETAVFALSGSVRISGGITTVLMMVFGIINMYCKEYKGSPLLPWDITSIRTAMHVAGTFSFTINFRVIFMVCMAAASFALLWHLPMPPKHKKNPIRLAIRTLSLVYTLMFALIFWGTDLIAREFGAAPDFFNQSRGYETNGAWAEFMVNTRYLHLSAPKNYDPDHLRDLVTNASDEDTPSILVSSYMKQGKSRAEAEALASVKKAEKPNLVVIMNESFSDLSVIGDFSTNIPYMPYIDSLINQENVIEGNAYVSTIGTGTSNTEYEFLTGNPMAFLPAGSNAYQLYVSSVQPGFTSTVKKLGYSADAFHPYYGSSWNRPNVYNAMGFQSFTSQEDLNDMVKVRRFASDDYDFHKIEEMYEERDPDQPFYLFNITMQNHSSYEKQYENFEQTVYLTDMEKEYPQTDQYLSLIKSTDDAFKELLDYFRNVEEPTIVMMFGDHQPFIENGFYEEVMGQRLSAMDDATAQKRYITRFILWANYDIPEAWIDQISVNYLSALLSDVAGLEMTEYQKFQEAMFAKVPVITALGCIDCNGTYFSADDGNMPYSDDVLLYNQAAYNNVIDTKHRQKELFYLRD